jgi:hypothetical protein
MVGFSLLSQNGSTALNDLSNNHDSSSLLLQEQLWASPGFPVGLGGIKELHAASQKAAHAVLSDAA